MGRGGGMPVAVGPSAAGKEYTRAAAPQEGRGCVLPAVTVLADTPKVALATAAVPVARRAPCERAGVVRAMCVVC